MSDFNRGLEQGIALGELKERERIVNLIEELFSKSVVPGYQTAVADAIAIIKGEDK